MSRSGMKSRLTWMALVLVTVCLLTLCILFWENSSLVQQSTSRFGMSEDPHRLMMEQSEINGQPIRTATQLTRVSPKGRKGKMRRPGPKLPMHGNSRTHHVNKEKEDTWLDELEPSYYNEDPIVNFNPLNHATCQNALIDKHGIDKQQMIAQHLPLMECTNERRKRHPQRHEAQVPHIWTREFLSAVHAQRCFEPRTPIRSTRDFYDGGHHRNVGNEIPVFYHIPKCASSSTAAMTSDLFNWSIHWQMGPEQMHEAVHTACGFAWIRDPMQRFISAYYTINKKIYREMHHVFNDSEPIPERFRDRLSFLTLMGEPQRFEAFVNDLYEAPDWWGIEDPLKHIASQTYFLSNWYGSDINFFGRVEHFGAHWKQLLNEPKCHWFKDLYAGNDEADLENYEVQHALFHYGTMGITLYKSRETRSKEYIDALGMRDVLEKMYGPHAAKYNLSEDDVLPPAYYFIAQSEELYRKIADFYYQDYVCFGYKADFNEFKKFVSTKKNPFAMDA